MICSANQEKLSSVILRPYKKVQVGKDQEKAQSEKDSHSKNQIYIRTERLILSDERFEIFDTLYYTMQQQQRHWSAVQQNFSCF